MTVAEPTAQGVVTLADIVRVLGQIKSYWLGGAVAGFAVALIAGFLMRPVYRATTVVMPAAGKDVAGGAVAGLLSRFGGDLGLAAREGSQRDEALAVLKSRQFAEQLIIGEKLLPVFFAEKWDEKAGKWLEVDAERIPTNWDAWTYFDRRIRTILEDRDRGLITIRVEWFDPELAARWANVMVARANDDLRARKLREIETSLEFLQVELGKTQLVELRTAISKVMESQINERMLANSRPEYAFRVVDPAVASDLDQPERPKRLLMAAIGLTVGALTGLVCGLIFAYARRQPDPASGG